MYSIFYYKKFITATAVSRNIDLIKFKIPRNAWDEISNHRKTYGFGVNRDIR